MDLTNKAARDHLKTKSEDSADVVNGLLITEREFCRFCSDYGITKMNSYFSEKDGRDIATTNQIVFEKLFYDEVLNKNGLRNKKEFVNHKILDCIGDLFLSGYKVVGKIICSQGGHKLTNDLLRKVYKDKKNFSLHEIKEKTLSNTLINKVSLRSIA